MSFDNTEFRTRLSKRGLRTGNGHDLSDYGQKLNDEVTPFTHLPDAAVSEAQSQPNQRWVDKAFSGKSALGDVGAASRVKWLPIEEVFGNTAQFEVDGLTGSDIAQGALGNCWFLGALAAVAGDKSLIEMVIRPKLSLKYAEKHGIYTFFFFKLGSWRAVSVDSMIPTLYGRPAFGRSTQKNEFWVTLVEKAYAKFHGSYGALKGGFVSRGLMDLTGGFPETHRVPENISNEKDREKLGVIWAAMQASLRAKVLLGAGSRKKGTVKAAGGTGETKAGEGIIGGHAYTITRVQTVEIAGKSRQLLTLRNPWARSEWTGKFSDGDKIWKENPSLLKKVGHTVAEDGLFIMELSDFARYFSTLYVCTGYEGWSFKSIRGEFSGDDAGAYPGDPAALSQYLLQVKRFPTPINIRLHRPDPRMGGGKASSIGYARVHIFRVPEAKANTESRRRRMGLTSGPKRFDIATPFYTSDSVGSNTEFGYVVGLKANLEVGSYRIIVDPGKNDEGLPYVLEVLAPFGFKYYLKNPDGGDAANVVASDITDATALLPAKDDKKEEKKKKDDDNIIDTSGLVAIGDKNDKNKKKKNARRNDDYDDYDSGGYDYDDYDDYDDFDDYDNDDYDSGDDYDDDYDDYDSYDDDYY